MRDVEWAGGYNERTLHARNHLEQSFPRIVFAEEAVEEIDWPREMFDDRRAPREPEEPTP